MQFIFGFSRTEYLRRVKEWHDWFAWRPVVVDVDAEGRKVWIWLQTVERRLMTPDRRYTRPNYRQKAIKQ